MKVKKDYIFSVRDKCLKFSDTNVCNAIPYNITLFMLSSFNINSLIDFGSQEGQFANRVMTELGVNHIKCVDIDPTSVNNGRKRFPKIDWECSDMLDYKFQKQYDAITSINWFFYLDKDERIEIYKKVSKIKGVFIITYGDINFHKLHNMSSDSVVDEIKTHMRVLNVVKGIDYETANDCTGRWYTSIACVGVTS